METNFKIGDRVRILEHDLGADYLLGLEGEIVATDRDGDFVIKADDEIGDYDYGHFSGYKSDKKDLVNIQLELGHELEKI